jgi:small subunit ribosomal protein S5
MSEDTKTNEKETDSTKADSTSKTDKNPAKKEADTSETASKSEDSKNKKKKKKKKKKNRRKRRRGGSRRDEFDAEIIDVRRVTRVVSGGRRFSFRVAAVAGNYKGKVGVGLGKANDISDAIGKAINNAKKNSIKIALNDDNTIPHELSAKYNATKVDMYPAPGRGLVSGSSVRDVVRLAGIKDVSTKLISRSKNRLNNARAAVAALKKIRVEEN